jgi:hypothetical protein
MAACATAREQAGYKRRSGNFPTDLRTIRPACHKKKKGNKLHFKIESIGPHLNEVAKALKILNATIQSKDNSGDYS